MIAARIQQCAAVVFDLDDTLYLERDYVRSGARAVAREVAAKVGFDPDEAERELCKTVRRNPSDDPFGKWLRRRGLDAAAWMPRALECYRAHSPDIELGPGVERLLSRVARKRSIGLVSDGRYRQQRLKVAALRLERWPISIVLSDELGRHAWKPSVEPYRRALEMLGVAAEQAVYVGDNPAKDFLGARRAGMLSVRLRRRGGLHERYEPSRPEDAPDLEARSLQGLERILIGAKRMRD